MEKYKIRKRRKPLNPMLVFAVFGFCMFLIACGYAMLSDKLEINGTANFKPLVQDDEQAMLQVGEVFTPMPETAEYSNSKYSYKNVSNWQQGDGTYIYQIELEITNLEEDFTSGKLEVSFEENNGLFEKQSQENLGITQADKVLISGNKITILLTETNSIVKYGDKINILAYLTYEEEQPEGIIIQNVTLNGKLLSEDKDTSNDEDTSNNTNTILKNEVNTNTVVNEVANTITNTTTNTNTVENEISNNEKESKEQSGSSNSQTSLTSEKVEEREEM